MHRILEIRQTDTGQFSYCLSGGSGNVTACTQVVFDSVEACMCDAGEALGADTNGVELHLNGRSVGLLTPAQLRTPVLCRRVQPYLRQLANNRRPRSLWLWGPYLHAADSENGVALLQLA